MPGKLPWMKFDPSSWLSDERLRLCSIEARGLWIDLLSLMHKCVRMGYLIQANGQPFSHEQIARVTGLSSERAAHLCSELVTSGVASVNEHGVIYSRRMVRDEEIRKARSKAGSRGGLATASLLKQNMQQKCSKGSSNALTSLSLSSSSEKKEDVYEKERARGGGAGGGDLLKQNAEQNFGSSAEGLAQEFAFYFAGTSHKERDVSLLTPVFKDLLDRGVKAEDVRKRLLDPKRPKTQYVWQFVKAWDGFGTAESRSADVEAETLARRKHLREMDKKVKGELETLADSLGQKLGTEDENEPNRNNKH